MDRDQEERIGRECSDKLRDRTSIDEIVEHLHAQGLSVIESMKILGKYCGVSLSVAKDVVTSHPVWRDHVARHEPFHDELEQIMSTPSDDTN